MAKLQLSVAIGDYDRMRPLVDGAVSIDAVDPQFMLLEPEEIFFRAFRHADFDITELSMSSYCVKTASGTSPYIAVPIFPSRAFRHTSIYVRTDRIKSPQDLKGKRVGVPEYQLTANVWVRLFLEEDHGIRPSDITWVRGGYEQAGRVEKIGLSLPADVHLESAPEGATISRHAGVSASSTPSSAPARPPASARGVRMSATSTSNPQAAAADWFRPHAHIPDYASAWHPPQPRRGASLAPIRRGQGVRTIQGRRSPKNSATPRRPRSRFPSSRSSWAPREN